MPLAKMTMGQMSELLFMVTLPWFFRRLGVKYTLMLGMFRVGLALRLFCTETAATWCGCSISVSSCTESVMTFSL